MEDSIKIGIITNCKAGLELALKLLGRGHGIALCKTDDMISNSDFVSFSHEFSSYNADLVADVETLIQSLPLPRTILIICKNYSSDRLGELTQLISPGDTIVDFSDSFYKESARNTRAMKKLGVSYISTGYIYVTDNSIDRPSFMISGNPEVAKRIQYYLSDISASVSGKTCAAYLGPEGVGQFTKMVATGMYYAHLELISEAVDIMQKKLGFDSNDIADILSEFNSGEASSFLLDTASAMFVKIDAFTGHSLADVALDRVQRAKKDGWIGRSSTELDCPVPTISAALDVHFASQRINERVAASGICDKRVPKKPDFSEGNELVERCRKALYLGMACSIAQGFSMIKTASDRYLWNTDMAEVAACLQGGTILQSDLMLRVFEILERNPKTDNLITSAYFTDVIREYSDDVRKLLCECINDGIAVPAISSVINYIDMMRTRKLPSSNSQLIRDSISGVGFERIDRSGIFSGEWQSASDTVNQNKVTD